MGRFYNAKFVRRIQGNKNLDLLIFVAGANLNEAISTDENSVIGFLSFSFIPLIILAMHY